MKAVLSILALCCLFALLAGCENAGESTVVDDAAVTTGNANQETETPEGTPDKPPANATEQETFEWALERLKHARDAGSDSIGDSTEWVTDTFNTLKDQGLTTAGSAKDWVTSDFKNMHALQYKIVTADMSDTAALEVQLNELGAEGWECFHVEKDSNNGPVFFFKKPKRSYLKNIPMKDLLKMLPLMDGGAEGQ